MNKFCRDVNCKKISSENVVQKGGYISRTFSSIINLKVRLSNLIQMTRRIGGLAGYEIGQKK